jgi:hypothetical protein
MVQWTILSDERPKGLAAGASLADARGGASFSKLASLGKKN